MNGIFPLLDDLAHFLEPLPSPWFVSGGWAIDLHLGRVTRKRCDLDISVPYTGRRACLAFFLQKGWRVEGKLGAGFKRLNTLADYQDEIHYFWSFPEGVDFISTYTDEDGNRRIAYNRETQETLDYIEVFFDRIEHGQFVYRRDPRVRLPVGRAVLDRGRLYCLAPEMVLLYKSAHLSPQNQLDFDAVISELDAEALAWLRDAFVLVYEGSHPWLGCLK